jgi:hypothetical protein
MYFFTLFSRLPNLIVKNCFVPGPSINGVPALSNPTLCDITAKFLSVFSFQNDAPYQAAAFAAPCKQGVLLPAKAAGGARRCACKFLVPHFSAFGVSEA